MPIIVKRPKALSDLAQIWDYSADDSPERADAFLATIDARFQTLSQHPAMGRRGDELAPELRSFPRGVWVNAPGGRPRQGPHHQRLVPDADRN